MRSAPESTWIGDPEVVNYAKITDKPVRSVLATANRSKFLPRLPFPREFFSPLRPCDHPIIREFEEISKRKKKRWSISRSRLVSFDEESIDPCAKQEIDGA